VKHAGSRETVAGQIPGHNPEAFCNQGQCGIPFMMVDRRAVREDHQRSIWPATGPVMDGKTILFEYDFQ